MWLRLIMSAGLMAVGYYLGREVGKQESLRRELAQGRERGVSVEIDDSPAEESPDLSAGT